MPAPNPPRLPLRVAMTGSVFEEHMAGLGCPCMPLLQPVYGDGEHGPRLLGTSLYHRSRLIDVRTGGAGDA